VHDELKGELGQFVDTTAAGAACFVFVEFVRRKIVLISVG
jgi:hypothetical protein